MEGALTKFVQNDDKLPLAKCTLLEILVSLTRFCADGTARESLHPDNFGNLARILHDVLDSNTASANVFSEAFRFLRNSVVNCQRNQNAVRDANLFIVTQTFLQYATSSRRRQDASNNDAAEIVPDDYLISVRCCLQFLSNSMAPENEDNANWVVSTLFDELCQVILKFGEDEKITVYMAMVLHIAMKTTTMTVVLPDTIIDHLLNHLHLEFVVYAMESFVRLENLAEQFGSLAPASRIRLLNFLITRNDLMEKLNETMVSSLKTGFIERSDFILRAKLDDRDNVFSWEISVLLEALCCLSLTGNGKTMKSDRVLLTTTLYLLKQIDQVGKLDPQSKDNVFSIVEDLDKLTSKSSEKEEENEIRSHPTFQFKAHLIRFIGNISYRDEYNQNMVRELGCLPIILDSCKLDARNPFIAQWSVLAIRNLCEGNNENQEFIKDVQRVDTENLIPKLGHVSLNS